MREKTEIKPNFMLAIKMFWKPDEQDEKDITEFEGLNKDELKEYKETYNAIKKLEDKYGIEPKKIRNATKKSTTIKKATITKGNKEKVKEEKAKEVLEDKIHDRE